MKTIKKVAAGKLTPSKNILIDGENRSDHITIKVYTDLSPSQKKALQAVQKYFLDKERCAKPFFGDPKGMTKEVVVEDLVESLDNLSGDWNYEFCGVPE